MEILDEPVETILKLINKIRMKINDISTDKVPTIRKFFLEFIPNILQKLRAINNQSLNEYLYEYLVDTIFGQFFCEEVIFRQTARALVLQLLDRQLLTEAAVEQCVQNVLKSHPNDDLPIFMFYITPILGAEQTRKYFWTIFLDVIEGDPGSTVRKQCVRLIAILGSILGEEVIEKDLLPIYIKLSKTSEWAIRKECALELPKISVLCSQEMREKMLTPVMEELLTDPNKWVHTAAAEKLGIFIATFAEPELLTLAINADGDLYVVNVADNENYKTMLSEEKLKNYQFYEDMFAETLIPTGADLGGSFGGVPLSNLFSTSPFSPLYHTTTNSSQMSASKTIICDSSWNNAGGLDGGSSGYFLTALDGGEATANERLAASLEKLEEGVGFSELGTGAGGGPSGKEKDEGEDNPYQKFVNPNFLLNLSSFTMNASTTSPSPSSSPSSSSPIVTNPFHSLSLFSKKLDRDFHMYNNNNNNSNKINNNNNADVKENNLSKAAEEKKEDSSQDSNGNEVAGTDVVADTNLLTDPSTATGADDVFNNNENPPESLSSTTVDPPLDNKTTTAAGDGPTSKRIGESNNNNYTELPASTEASVEQQQQPASSNLEQELAKLTLSDAAAPVAEEDEDVNRTSAHLKRATPEGLPHVIKMAIKEKKCKKGLKGLCLPQPLLPMQNVDDEDNNNDKDLSPPQTPSIEDAPTTCPFGGETLKTPETARIMDLEKEQDLFKAAGDGHHCEKLPSSVDDEEQSFYSNNYWYVKPLELTVDELDLIESGGPTIKQEAPNNNKEITADNDQEMDLEKNLPPPPPPEDDDDDLPEPVEKRKLFSLYSMKYKSYKLGEDSGSGLMSSSMKASRDELLDNLFSSESTHLMMVKKSDISPSLMMQRVVPPILLHFYMEMSNFPEWDQICAYSFPAVVLTMGKNNWPLMKNQLQTLCSAIRWEVRQILVASIYQIALIIGRDFASQDLVPVFVSFFKDLDNVKIEALHNVAKFLQVIDKRRHIEIVAHLSECLEPENVTNWRFRMDLATEILKLMEIYKNDLEETAELGQMTAAEGSQQREMERGLMATPSPTAVDNLALINEECLKYLTGYALRLLMDRVHSVREVAMEAIVSRMRFCTEVQLWDLIAIIIKSFAQSSHWRRRQIYGQLCETLIQQNAIDMAEFEQKMLTPLITMAEDKVPNVRLVVAKCLLKCAQNAYFTESLERRLKLEVILRQLEKDADRDVRESTNATDVTEDAPVENRGFLDETIDDSHAREEVFETAEPACEDETPTSSEAESALETSGNINERP